MLFNLIYRLAALACLWALASWSDGVVDALFWLGMCIWLCLGAMDKEPK